jgi:hypothetical protein
MEKIGVRRGHLFAINGEVFTPLRDRHTSGVLRGRLEDA